MIQTGILSSPGLSCLDVDDLKFQKMERRAYWFESGMWTRTRTLNADAVNAVNLPGRERERGRCKSFGLDAVVNAVIPWRMKRQN